MDILFKFKQAKKKETTYLYNSLKIVSEVFKESSEVCDKIKWKHEMLMYLHADLKVSKFMFIQYKISTYMVTFVICLL